MNAERARAFLMTLPHVVETVQWEGALVFWVGDKAIGGKMFALMRLDGDLRYVVSYPVGAERYGEMMEMEGLVPAPYLARAFWVAAETWRAHRDAVWEEEFRTAHALTLVKLPGRVRKMLDSPMGELRRVVLSRRKMLVERGTGKKPA